MPANRQRSVNVSRKPAITAREALEIANQQIWQREFNADYDQIMLRFSTATVLGLKNGEPPPSVS